MTISIKLKMIRKLSALPSLVKERLDSIDPYPFAGALFLIFFVFPLFCHGHPEVAADVGRYVNDALRVVNGELPYKDFWLYFPPGEVFLPAFIYKVFGVNVNIVLISSVFISALVGLASFLLSRLIVKDNSLALLSASLVFFGGLPATYGNLYLRPVTYFLFLLVSAYLLLLYFEGETFRKLFLSGIFIGLAFFFKIYEVGGAFVAFVIAIILHYRLSNRAFNYCFKPVMIFCGGALLSFALLTFPLIKIYPIMLKQIIVESISTGVAVPSFYFQDSVVWLGYTLESFELFCKTGEVFYGLKAFINLVRLINATLLYLLPFLLIPVSFLYLSNRGSGHRDRITVLFFLMWGLLVLPKILARCDLSELSPSTTVLSFLLVYLLKRYPGSQIKKKSAMDSLITTGLAVVAILLLATSILPHIRNLVSALKRPHYEVNARNGTLLLEDKLEAESINSVISFIEKNTKEGDYIYAPEGNGPLLHALTNRRSPTYYGRTTELFYVPDKGEALRRACNDLIQKETKLIIHYHGGEGESRIFRYLEDRYPFFKGLAEQAELAYQAEVYDFQDRCALLYRFIEDNFERVAEYGQYWIYVPRGATVVF